MAHLIVEQTFDIPLTDEEHGQLGQKLDKCLDAYGARWMRSYLSTDRRRMVCREHSCHFGRGYGGVCASYFF